MGRQAWACQRSGYRLPMWLDSQGVGHTVALSDPSSGMSPETVASLNALSASEQVRVLEALDDWYWNEYIASSRDEFIASILAPVGAPLPQGFVIGTISSAAEALAIVRATEPAWRIDVLEAIQDYLEQGA